MSTPTLQTLTPNPGMAANSSVLDHFHSETTNIPTRDERLQAMVAFFVLPTLGSLFIIAAVALLGMFLF